MENNILYEDNHIIVIEKLPGDIVQGDKTGDLSLLDEIKNFLKIKYNKPGNVYLGLVHRIDRPVGGVLIYAKTSKAASRLSKLMQTDDVKKTYLAVTYKKPSQDSGTLIHYLYKNEKQNKSYALDEHSSTKIINQKKAKKAILNYKYIGSSLRYHLLEIDLITGRHHQIRCQLASIGCVIKGDLKYGAPRSNEDASISLWANKLEFKHPVKNEIIKIKSTPKFYGLELQDFK
ncbi:MAG: RluA family pseudouridine synthase [Bacteroidales bacterium]|jgi:23S rRNA pseudouridine1911/1915/1917 synthase